ncbi:MAG: hypothetical protein F6K18_08415 [Okeania sp. SIO2C2]|uniref:hypothetical protein n=1 Tax=Okeania sp. SIO2C2 TaxID=2607787 RepID=UPI0013BE5DDB|nr:hypothetical protein [Okeania sp. SIO2C2]NEP86853.1 hypothetical protein [Okeania sp. SIO2C2]
MSHEIIAIRRPVRPKQPIEPNSPKEALHEQIESKVEKPNPIKNSPSSRTEGTNERQLGKPISKSERPKKPGKPKLKESIQQVTNANGKVFSSGDKILVSAPWSSIVEAEITGFYKSPGGSIWAIFLPQESLPKWKWEKGCIRAELLKQA